MYYTVAGQPIQPRDWHDQAVEMAKKGYGATKIAKKLLGRKSQESTVRDFLSKVDFNRMGSGVNILYWDTETSPHLSAHWGFWGENIGKGSTVRQAGMLSHAWAWGDGEIYSSVLTPEEAMTGDYSRLVHEMWHLLDNAAVVVAHNGKKFDIKRANAEFIKIGLPPPSPYKVYDTLQVAKKHFRFSRNDLDSLCDLLKIPYRKVKNEGMPLWVRCIQGDPQALADMETYNRGDIPTLRELFKKFLPWDNQGINFALLGGNMNNCPHCNENSLVETDKNVYSNNRRYKLYRCTRCGANARSAVNNGRGTAFLKVN